jgi:hypothetical protein
VKGCAPISHEVPSELGEISPLPERVRILWGVQMNDEVIAFDGEETMGSRRIRHWSFVIGSSFVIRDSSFL